MATLWHLKVTICVCSRKFNLDARTPDTVRWQLEMFRELKKGFLPL